MNENNNLNNPVGNPLPPVSEPTTNNNEDDTLLKLYICNNYEKITTKKFNFAAFFLSTLYLFYRKMFGYGVLVF